MEPNDELAVLRAKNAVLSEGAIDRDLDAASMSGGAVNSAQVKALLRSNARLSAGGSTVIKIGDRELTADEAVAALRNDPAHQNLFGPTKKQASAPASRDFKSMTADDYAEMYSKRRGRK